MVCYVKLSWIELLYIYIYILPAIQWILGYILRIRTHCQNHLPRRHQEGSCSAKVEPAYELRKRGAEKKHAFKLMVI